MHEITVNQSDDNVLQGMLTPMVFESFQTENESDIKDFPRKKTIVENPFVKTLSKVQQKPEQSFDEELTKVSMHYYQQEQVANFGGQEDLHIDLKLAKGESAVPLKALLKREISDISPNNIVRVDLVQLVNSIFEEEYDPRKIKKLCQV